MDMQKSLMFGAVATEHVDQGHSLFHAQWYPNRSLRMEVRKQTNKYVTCLSFVKSHAFNKGIKSIYYARTFTQMTVVKLC